MPADFVEALDQAADARRHFDGLSYSHKRRYVLSIEDAKTAETRQRRITKAVNELREGPHRLTWAPQRGTGSFPEDMRPQFAVSH